MARFQVDTRVLSQVKSLPEVRKRLDQFAVDILEDSKGNMALMDAIDTGTMRDSGFVEREGDTIRIGYEAEYSAIVHEGTGIGRNARPRPFLTKAVTEARIR